MISISTDYFNCTFCCNDDSKLRKKIIFKNLCILIKDKLIDQTEMQLTDYRFCNDFHP